ncbi:Hypothetical protein NTJ_07256 [Nesidiocoris tenuis]|uniref:Uncharacterized protein n=1 Tax=Nesidiocoris tenuis TaxID=355587 RepID=A0ABN7AVH2_9HEMI|nr:Hypothetical protein NTJ_07256 [Nesidiocoris tenuis]
MVRKSESRPRLRYQRHQIGVILRPRVPSLSGVRVRPSPSLSDTRLRPEHAHHIGANLLFSVSLAAPARIRLFSSGSFSAVALFPQLPSSPRLDTCPVENREGDSA